ncbi:hypothetical protein NB706_003697 [Xanthomonas sacchari]|nr:hypothetical protein [Xanthomonas sacchari]
MPREPTKDACSRPGTPNTMAPRGWPGAQAPPAKQRSIFRPLPDSRLALNRLGSLRGCGRTAMPMPLPVRRLPSIRLSRPLTLTPIELPAKSLSAMVLRLPQLICSPSE